MSRCFHLIVAHVCDYTCLIALYICLFVARMRMVLHIIEGTD